MGAQHDGPAMAINHARPATHRRRRAAATPAERGCLALTAALYPDGDVVCAEILELDVACRGDDFEHACAMIVEAVEGAVEAAHACPPDTLDRFLREHRLTVHPERPPGYRPAAIPSNLLQQPGLILRPVSISIEAAIRR